MRLCRPASPATGPSGTSSTPSTSTRRCASSQRSATSRSCRGEVRCPAATYLHLAMNPDIDPLVLLARALMQACRERDYHVAEHAAFALAQSCDADRNLCVHYVHVAQPEP